MSGSGGSRTDYDTATSVGSGTFGSGGAGGAGGGGGDDPCAIVQTASLNSPNPAVVPHLTIGDMLDLHLGGTPPRNVLEARTAAGRVAGSLTHVGHLSLIRCMQAGHAYRAEVTQRLGGTVVVQIERT